MKAVVLIGRGGPEMLELREVPDPSPGPDDAIVRVGACGIGSRDVIERQRGSPRMQYPIIQGHEFAGEIVALGAHVTEWAVGDRVINLYTAPCGSCSTCLAGQPRRCQATLTYGQTVDGGYAEYVRVHRAGLVRLAAGIGWPIAGTLMSAIGVAYNNVVHKAQIKAGENVLVTGASGGVGMAVIQIAKYLGAQVWAVTANASKAAALRGAGADEVIVDDGRTIHKQVRVQRPDGVDAVIDCVGSPTLNGSLRSVRRYGRVVVIGNLDPEPLQLNLGLLVVNGIDLLGSNNVTKSVLEELMPLVQGRRIKVPIDQVVPLEGIAGAHRRIESRAMTGRIVIVPA